LSEFADPIVERIVAFLRGIGIEVRAEPLTDTFLPGATVRHGALIFDPEALPWPGDLLHEAGHIAVTDPKVRTTLDAVSGNPGEEVAAIAWSYAAALAAEVDPAIVFHGSGYGKAGGGYLVEAFETSPCPPGMPLLAWYGLTIDPARAEAGEQPYPHMIRWLR
jgi:hypothetical protein